MPVFSPNQISQLTGSIRILATMMLDKMPFSLSGDEFISAYIAPEHVSLLKQTEELIGMVGNNYGATSALANDTHYCEVHIAFVTSSPIIVPNYVRHGYQASVPAAVKAKLSNWLTERIRMGEMFGDALDALYYLNDTCGDIRAVGIMFPALPVVLGAISSDPEATSNRRAKKLVEGKGFGSLPRLPREVKDRLVDVSNLLTATTLITDAAMPEYEKHDARFTLQSQSVRRSHGHHERMNIFTGLNKASFV